MHTDNYLRLLTNHFQLASTIAILVAICVSWVRRHTWHMPWELPATFNVAMQGLYSLLACPAVSKVVSPPLHRVTGLWNVGELIGALAYLAGMAALVYMFAARLDWEPHQFRRFIMARIELPATVFVPTYIGAFVLSGAGRKWEPTLELVDLGERRAIAVYSLLGVMAAAWLVGHAIWALLIIRRDDTRSKSVVYLYFVAFAVTIACCVLFMLDGPLDSGPIMRFFALRLELVAYAVAASHSWRSKKRFLKFKAWRQIRRGKKPRRTKSKPADNPCPDLAG